PGISAAQRGRVFEPFYTTRADGLGLGLSLCETLAAGMDGRLDIVDGDEAPPRGAALRLSLPRATAATARTRTDPR
ncbi:MAG: ATP-binding protein, partial [Thauera sp.]